MTRLELPSFSIIIESENLAVEDSELLFAALETLYSQTISISEANEAILVNSGRIPSDTEATIREKYPALLIHTLKPGANYYEAKQDPVALTSGEVIVFCDCDCRYSTNWLQSLLSAFADPNIGADVVTGETSITLAGFQSFFIALAWCFPLYSKNSAPYKTSGYAANNVSFSRRLIDSFPMPTDLGIYRGNCSLHARELTDRGINIWKAPGARAAHPTLRPSHVPARFFMWGHHEARICIEKHRGSGNPVLRASRVLASLANVIARRLAMPFIRWPTLLQRRPLSVLHAPALLLYVAIADILFVLGIIATLSYPSMSLLGLAKTLEATEH